MKALAYISHRDAADLEAQRRAIRAWAKKGRHTVLQWCEDRVRANDPPSARARLLDALEGLRRDPSAVLAVERLQRLGTDLLTQERWILEARRTGSQVLSATGEKSALSDAPPAARATARQAVARLDEIDRAVKGGRLQAARRTKAAEGGFAFGSPPYGFRVELGQLVPVPEEQEAVERMLSWRENEGLSFAAIADRLNEGGTPARRGQWYPTTVSRVLARSTS